MQRTLYKKQLELNPTLTVKEIANYFDSNKSRIEKLYPFINDFEKFAHEKLMEAINYCGILSLTESNINEVMWGLYADSNKGFVLGLDSENAFFKPKPFDPDPSGLLIKVKYSDVTPKIYTEPFIKEIPFELFFTKTTQWSYEREWRMIKLLSFADELKNEKFHLFEIPTNALKEVIFGMKMPKEVREDIKSKIELRTNKILFKEATLNTNGEFSIV